MPLLGDNSDIVRIIPNNFGTLIVGLANGNSMNPTIMNNSILVYQPIDEIGVDNIKVNDIVRYSLNDMNITHRIIKINSDKFVAKGDNNFFDDGWQETRNMTHVLVAVIY